MFEYLGYSTGTTGQTTISFRVANKCKNSVGYVALGTSGFTRIAPANGAAYKGTLESYSVSWTNVTGNPGFVSIKFENARDNYKNGAMDVFTIAVANFNSNTSIPVQGKAGSINEGFTFPLSQTTCPPPSTRLFPGWMTGSWRDLLAWPNLLSANTSPPRAFAEVAANWPVTDAAAAGRRIPGGSQ